MFFSGPTVSVLKKISRTTSPQPAEGQTPVGRVSQRGRSMEELGGALQLSSRSPALSRSSERLEQLWRNHRTNLDTENPEEPLNYNHATKGWSLDPLGEPWSSPASSCIVTGTGTRTWTQPGPPSPATDMPSSNPLSPPAGVEVRSHSSSCTQVMPPLDDNPASK